MAHNKARLTVGTFLLDLWLPAIRPTVKPSTFSGYEAIVRNHILPKLGFVTLRQIKAEQLNVFYGYLLTSGHAINGGGLAAPSVIRVHAVLRRALRDAVRWDYLKENPATRADPPKQKMTSHQMNTWTASELTVFLQESSADADKYLWLLLAMTGMRRGEVLGLRWQDLDLDQGLITVRQTVTAIGGERVFSTPKTSRGRRVVALDASTVTVLRRWRAQYSRDATDLIFCEKDGTPLFGPAVTKRFNKIVDQAELPRIRLHDLRHTHATLALQLGIHPKIVSERLGHSTVAFTLDIYSHATPHMQSEAAERFGTLLNGEK